MDNGIKLVFGKDGKARILNEDYTIYCADKKTFEKVKEAVEKMSEEKVFSVDLDIHSIKAEAVKEFVEEINMMITEIYNKHIFGYNDLVAEEKDAIINFSDDVTSGLENLIRKWLGDTNGEI